ncbi:MAG TPA: hypothetical protein VGH07_08495, partial [Chthoniobacterales bacterium]
MSAIQITERFLMDTGGWQAMKHAKALLEMGRVISVNYTPPVLRGLVREGEVEFRAGLKIRSYTDVENICSCRESREWGTICAHSLALGLASIRPKPDIRSSSSVPTAGPLLPILIADAANSPHEGRIAATLPSDLLRIELHIVLPPNIETGWERDQIVVGFEVVRKGNRTLASALDLSESYYCSKSDWDILELGRKFEAGKLPGMTVLDRERFLQLVGTMERHPRVTIGRKTSVEISSDPILPALRTEIAEDGRWTVWTETKRRTDA